MHQNLLAHATHQSLLLIRFKLNIAAMPMILLYGHIFCHRGGIIYRHSTSISPGSAWLQSYNSSKVGTITASFNSGSFAFFFSYTSSQKLLSHFYLRLYESCNCTMVTPNLKPYRYLWPKTFGHTDKGWTAQEVIWLLFSCVSKFICFHCYHAPKATSTTS